MSKRAVILAGGKGTRLRPYTIELPKPLVPIGDYPILEIIIRQLARNGFDHITVTVNHQADMIKTYFGNGEKWKIKIDYSLEEKPLSTMGPLSLISDLPDHFLVMNGDILTDIDYSAFFEDHVAADNIFTISSFVREHVNLYGVLESDVNNKLIDFKEKPKTRFEVSMGIYMLSKAVLEHIPHNESYGFDHLMLDLIKAEKNATVRPFHGYWLDIGRPDDYMIAIDEFEKNKGLFLKDA
ncbi:MAG: NDP-sugar pyrophosphorylase family protein [Crocinitomix sp.]|jgi:NDP-sugar pyrophosphorylase family protein